MAKKKNILDPLKETFPPKEMSLDLKNQITSLSKANQLLDRTNYSLERSIQRLKARNDALQYSLVLMQNIIQKMRDQVDDLEGRPRVAS